jgi:hypothetical protein
MADLRKRFIEDYAGGLLNVARQELSTTGEVLAQDGLTSENTLFVEDGSGTKTGLKLGVSLAEAVDPTTETGVVNVRFADRTYAKLRDLKIFSTAIASAQAALSEAASVSISNLETTLQLLEDDISTVEQNFQQNLVTSQEQLQNLTLTQRDLEQKSAETNVDIAQLGSRVTKLESPVESPEELDLFEENTNTFYYTGTIAIANSVVTGTNTAFTGLEVGDIFITTTSAGEDVEFRITNITDDTQLNVTPTNKTVTAGSRFRQSRELQLIKKVNDILRVMKGLEFII